MAENGHARLAPSNHRWPHCPGSVREEAAYPDAPGDAAIDGTGSHLLLELCLGVMSQTGRKDVIAAEWLDRTIGEGHQDRPEGWLVKEDRCQRVQMVLDYINRRRSEVDIISVESEIQSNPGYYFGRNDWHGTVDVFIKGADFLEVIDLKDGRTYVNEKDDSQFISYAAGRLAIYMLTRGEVLDLKNCPIKTVRVTVVQPKTGTPVRYVDMAAAEVWEKATELAAAATLTDDPNAALISGKWCTWCKHGRSGNCPAKDAEALEGLKTMSEGGKGGLISAIRAGEIATGSMTGTQLSAIKDVEKIVTKLFKQVDAEMMSRLEKDPNSVPGFEIGTGNSKNVWAEDEDVIKKKLSGMRFLKSDIFPSKFITPAAALGHVYKDGKKPSERQIKAISGLIKKVPGPKKVIKSDKPRVFDKAGIFDNIPAPAIDFDNIPSFM